jgi:hypothetical protein
MTDAPLLAGSCLAIFPKALRSMPVTRSLVVVPAGT